MWTPSCACAQRLAGHQFFKKTARPLREVLCRSHGAATAAAMAPLAGMPALPASRLAHLGVSTASSTAAHTHRDVEYDPAMVDPLEGVDLSFTRENRELVCTVVRTRSSPRSLRDTSGSSS